MIFIKSSEKIIWTFERSELSSLNSLKNEFKLSKKLENLSRAFNLKSKLHANLTSKKLSTPNKYLRDFWPFQVWFFLIRISLLCSQKDGVSPLDNQTGAISRKSHNRSYNHGVCSMNQSLFNQLNCSFPINNRYILFHLVCAFSWFCRTCLCVFIFFFFFLHSSSNDTFS